MVTEQCEYSGGRLADEQMINLSHQKVITVKTSTSLDSAKPARTEVGRMLGVKVPFA